MPSLVLVTCLISLLLNLNDASDDILSHLTREKCVKELGCFSAAAPFFDIIERPLSLLPDDREDIDTKFLLYTPFNHEVSMNFSNLNFSKEYFLQSKFNPHANTKFVVPGFISHTAPEWKKPIVDALLLADGSNVFMVDWTHGDGPLYEQAVANTRIVGAEIALFINHLQSAVGIRPESVHVIGHSLGSHIAGYAGKRLKSLGRITAMDPAGPYFTNVDPVVRLDRKDAIFVDAIHTNAAPSRFQGFGLAESIAHFDFYPNGGHLQPGCEDMGHAILSFLRHPEFDAKGLRVIQCNHSRAIKLFISSITDSWKASRCDMASILCGSWDDFVAGKCGKCDENEHSSCVPLGIHADHFATMKKMDRSLNFYLNTTSEPPYCA